MRRTILIIIFCVALMAGCTAGITNQEVYNKAHDGLLTALNGEICKYEIRYTVDNGEHDIVSNFVVWQDGEDVYVENIQNGAVVGGKLITGGKGYVYSAESDSWELDEDSVEDDTFTELLNLYRNTEPDNLTYAETDGKIQVTFTCPSDDNGISGYKVSLFFDSDWTLNAYSVVPNIDDELDEGYYPVTTEVAFHNVDIVWIRETIDQARQRAVTDHE